MGSGIAGRISQKARQVGNRLFCRKVGIPSEDLLYVGDSEVDWQTANNAHCSHILVSWGFRPKDELLALEGSVVVDTVGELEDAIYGIQREGFTE